MATTAYTTTDSLDTWGRSNNDTDPIFEVPAGINIVLASQFKDGTAPKYTITAASGAECLGDISNPSAIATLDFQGADLYFRKQNVGFENLYIRWYDHKIASEEYSGLNFTNCVIDAMQDLSNTCNQATFTNCVILLSSGNIEDGGNTQVIYSQGLTNVTLDQCTIINRDGGTNGSVGVIQNASTGTLAINRSVVYSPSITGYGTTGVGNLTGDHNASPNDTLPGLNSISGVTDDIFTDYINGDYRIKAEGITTIGTLSANPAGAFVIPTINIDPVKDSDVPDQSFVFGTTDSYDISQHFSDANPADSLAYTFDNALPTGVTLSAAGLLEWDNTTSITASATFVVTATDGHGGTDATDTILLEITDVVPAIVNINTTDIVTPGTSVNISTVKLDASPGTQTVTLGGEVLTVTAWSLDSITVTVPLTINLLWDTTHTLSVTDDTSTVTSSGITLQKPSGWSTVVYDGTTIDEVNTNSFYEEAKVDTDVGSYTMLVGDTLAFEDATGFSVSTETYPTIDPPSTVAGSYKIWNVSGTTWTGLSSYSWNDIGAPVPSAVVFTGPIPDQASTTIDALTINFGTYFSEFPDSYSDNGTLPTGLTLNTATGAVTGTPTAPATYSGIIITGTNTTGSDSSGTFEWVISTKIIPVITGVFRDWDTNAVAASVTGINVSISETLGGTPITADATFNTAADGSFTVYGDDIVVGTEYYVSFSNIAETITELHKITAEAE